MCACCSNTQKKIWSIGVSISLIVIAIILGVVWKPLIQDEINKEFVLEEGTEIYENWMDPPVPMYLEIYLFDWVNPDDLSNPNIKPHFVEKGPYVFKEIHERVNNTWDDGNISFKQRRLWHFEPEMSKGFLNDTVTTIDVLYVTMAKFTEGIKVEGYDIQNIINLGIEENALLNGSMFWRDVPVEDIIFDGYDAELLGIFKALLEQIQEIEELQLPEIPELPEKFGWFYGRNGSSEYDGVLTIGTGKSNLNDLGMMKMWNGQNTSASYEGECAVIRGSTGEVWPPLREKPKQVSIFAPDICSSMDIRLDKEVKIAGLNGLRYVGDDRNFDNGNNYPESACFCGETDEICPVGFLNVSKCTENAPAFISFPHFYLADPKYSDKITGMKANKEQHEFSITVDPLYGIPLQVRASLQVNIAMRDYGLEFMKGSPEFMAPILWFKQVADMNNELAKDIKKIILIENIGVYLAYGIGSLGGLLLIISIWLTCTKWKNNTMTV